MTPRIMHIGVKLLLASLIAFLLTGSRIIAADSSPAEDNGVPPAESVAAETGENAATEGAEATADSSSAQTVADSSAPDAASDAHEALAAPSWTHPPVPAAVDGMTDIFVIPVHDQIGKTNKYILRRGIKEAIARGAEVVVLDVDSPGGRADYMLEMMEMIDRYDGRTIAYVDKEAVSAAALISASADEICFAPKSVIGAAAVISSDGKDIPHTLKTKIDSYMDARLRALTADNPRRADVLRAMMQEDYVLEIDGKVLKEKGVLLSRTANEAMELYGDPPTPLLGSGIYRSVEALADAQYGSGHYLIHRYDTTWSEDAAAFMEKIAPVLMGLGFLALVVEFYTPGFGLPGISGLLLLAIVFLGNYISGLAGHEPLLIFVLGFVLLMLEILLLPGVFVLAITGLLMMVGSLVWSLADVWPTSGGGFEVNPDILVSALWQVLLSIVIAGVIFALMYKFLPRRVLSGSLMLETVAGGKTEEIAETIAGSLPPMGSVGRAVTNLRPSGTIDIDGKHYEATLTVGAAEKGQSVKVVGHRNFQLLVALV